MPIVREIPEQKKDVAMPGGGMGGMY